MSCFGLYVLLLWIYKNFPTGWGNKATISGPTLQSVEMSLSLVRLILVQDNGPTAQSYLTSFLKHQRAKKRNVYIVFFLEKFYKMWSLLVVLFIGVGPHQNYIHTIKKKFKTLKRGNWFFFLKLFMAHVLLTLQLLIFRKEKNNKKKTYKMLLHNQSILVKENSCMHTTFTENRLCQRRLVQCTMSVWRDWRTGVRTSTYSGIHGGEGARRHLGRTRFWRASMRLDTWRGCKRPATPTHSRLRLVASITPPTMSITGKEFSVTPSMPL